MRRAIAALLGFGVAVACRDPEYRCAHDDQCVTDDQLGTCEPVGFCSYFDGTCPSRHRWGPQAGARANDCVAPSEDATSSTSTSDASTSETSTTDTSTTDTSTTDSTG